ncbi:HAD-IIA family hydrolase [Marisediminicola senii]|uniref:HAD-IIA family hydrolase n=1 Tax=Marisediminicola senii TaxID=2711233 RepID=UPI0013EDE27B|nr:HAD-IIA family hydrolase [Marisediminicola senii]
MTGIPTLVDGFDLLLADLDGVVYAGDGAIPHAVDSINSAARTTRIGYVTNNASRTADAVAGQLAGFGLAVTSDDVVTSPQAAVVLLADKVAPGSTVLVVGGEGLLSEVVAAGFVPTRSAEDAPAAVVQGFHPTVAWTDLAEATFAVRTGVPWIATNTDWTIPVARGIAPGNGTLVSAVHTAAGTLPVVAGKPEVPIFEAAMARFGTRNAIMIGDRLDTDILGGNRAGIPTAHVLTGIDQAKQLLAAVPDQRPTYLLDDLRQLHEPYPEVLHETADGTRTVTVGDAVVRIAGNRVTIMAAGRRPIDLLRAACAVIWGSGLAIYGLDVPAALYS